MSDLLQRMVEKTLKAGPSVRPVPVSRFEPPDFTTHGLQVTEDAHISTYQSQVHIQHNPSAHDLSGNQPVELARPAIPEQLHHQAGMTRTIIVPADTSSAGHSTATPSMYSQDVSAPANTVNEFEHSSPPAHELTANRAATTYQATASEQPSSTLPMKQQQLLERPVRPGHRQRSLPQDNPVPPAPEINISIGHIELRAAHAVQPSRKPAFRPQLSLNDFLNNKHREQGRE